ncbi:MAG TPA: molybdopterin-synthase adenylyltransferase MoeB [Blastocatellia bacterium]|nr:molybdopterin-synthase adenylyltransferase MoeB [Blastocatellia bacterium]
MAVSIYIPTALRSFTGGNESVAVEAGTAAEALGALIEQHPNLKKHLYNDEGQLRHFVNVYVNDEDIRYLDKGDTRLKDGDTVSIVPSIAGGSAVIEETAANAVELDKDEILRYSRHLIMPEVALEGQKKLKAAKVLCIGAGGLGSPLALYLAAAGVGRLGIVDFDVVDFTNLQRQIIHSTANVGRPKLESAKERIAEINPFVQVDTYEEALTSENALALFRDYDIVVDGTDNFPTRYLVNDACVLLGKPNVYGSIFRFEGQATVFYAKEGPCYRCLYPEPPPPGLVPSCAEGGVLGVLPGIIGVIQAIETVKLILGKGESLIGRLVLFDALKMKFRELKLRKNPECPVCGVNPTVTELIDYQEFCGVTPQAEVSVGQEFEITPAELKAKMDRGDDFVLIDVREPEEYAIARIQGSRLIPRATLPERVHELSSADDIVVHCKSGVRSGMAVDFLKQAGFRRVKNLVGGILRWSDDVDPAVPKY